MPFKRPSPTRDSSQSSSNTGPRLKRARSRSPSHDQASSSSHITVITVYIVQAKLDPEIVSDLFRVAEGDQVFEDGHRNGVRFNLCHDVGEAEVVVTAVHMRRRLERHIDWGIAVRETPFVLSYHNPHRHVLCISERSGDSYPPVASGLGKARQAVTLRRLCRLA